MTARSDIPFATRVLDARVSFTPRSFRTPLLLSSGSISEVTEAEAEVRVQVEGREAVGRSSIYLSDLWSWPDPAVPHAERDAAMRTLCDRIAASLPALVGGEPHHPLELGMRLHEVVTGLGNRHSAIGNSEVHALMPNAECRMPALARSICLSPFDAAIHDAAGQALGISAFRFYDGAGVLPTADTSFPGGGAIAAIRRTLRAPEPALTAWLIVGSGDGEWALEPWVRDHGYHAFKLKLGGSDNAADVARTIAVYRMTRHLLAREPRLCVDSNCANPDAESVRDYLERLQRECADAFAALEYVEQPTGRDITVHAFEWRPVTALKPVLLDEGLIDPDRMEIAHGQGWNGFALKTCKGHSFLLVAAAWAAQRGMRLALQDLTNPGYSAIHAFLCGAHLPLINGVELNSPQFTPSANADWLPRLAPLFEPADGFHRLPGGIPAGLGSAL